MLGVRFFIEIVLDCGVSVCVMLVFVDFGISVFIIVVLDSVCLVIVIISVDLLGSFRCLSVWLSVLWLICVGRWLMMFLYSLCFSVFCLLCFLWWRWWWIVVSVLLVVVMFS